MSIGTIRRKEYGGQKVMAPTFADRVAFAGDNNYNTGGTRDIEASLQAITGDRREIIDIIPGDCGVYLPQAVDTPAEQLTGCAFPVADQVGKTITYKLDGGAEQTVTLAGAHTSAAHLAASLNAEAGLDSYVDGAGACVVRTTDGGPHKTLEITGGTANAVYLFPTTVSTGSLAKRLKVRDLSAAGAEIALASDVSGTTFNMTVISQ